MVTITGDMDFSAIFNAENMKGLREMATYFMNNKGECEHDKN
jgi:hypothetical protein